MRRINCLASGIFRTVFFLVLFAPYALGDSFEFLEFVPPNGWLIEQRAEQTSYRRPAGIGAVVLYSSYSSTGMPTDEFAKTWRARVESVMSVSAPQPQVQRDGDFTALIGGRQVNAQGTVTSISLVVFVGRGRALGILAITAGDDAFREAAAFLDSVKIGKGQPTPVSGEIDLEFTPPPGYQQTRSGSTVVLKPVKMDGSTPCIYGISASRPSTGNLENDARAALLEPHPGWRIKDQSFNAMRGVSGGGWKYFWFRTGIESMSNGNYLYVNAMAMAIEAGNGKTSIVWGVGNAAHCMLDDSSFSRLFHSLRPKGWTSDNGSALAREIQGMWRNTQRLGMAQYKFLPGGRYEFGLGTTTVTGIFERTSSSVSDGRYSLAGSRLTLTPDRRDRGASNHFVRVYDHYNSGGWIRVMALTNESSDNSGDIEYSRIGPP